MGRKGSVPAGEGFLPGTSAGELARLARKEMDGKTARKYVAAYHRKAGKSFNEIAEIVLDTYVAVRNWLVAMHKGGLEAAPRRKSPGRRRTIPLAVRHSLIIDVHRGPQASGYKANAWTFRLLHQHLKDKYGLDIAYSTAAKYFNDMGVRLKVPRPAHPQAASPEKRLAFQKESRKKILAAAKDGYHVVFSDEGHVQGYKNGHKTAALRGVEAVRTSGVGRARLSIFVAVGYGWFFIREASGPANSEEYIGFLDRLSELVGRIMTVDDNAGYHNSNKSTGHIEANPGRLRRISTLPYTPNDNSAEPQIRAVKAAMSNVGLDSVGAISSELRGCIESGLIDPVKFYGYATVAGLPRISPRKAASIKKRLEPGEHFVHVQKKMSDKEAKLPTVEELRTRDEKILPPERRAMLPAKLANSNIPANFLARLPPILLAE